MDLRVEKTYKALVEAFTKLVGEMHIEEVTVALLCDRAMVRRTTFYRHFADKDEFVRFYVLSMRDEIEARALGGEADVSLRDYVMRLTRELAAFCLENEHMVNNILGGSSFGTLFTMMGDVVRRMTVLRLKSHESMGAVNGIPIDTLATFISGGVIQAVLTWWNTGHDRSTDIAAGLDTVLDRLLP